jgi:hypothetical protein
MIMDVRASGGAPRSWLATTIKALLEEKYGPGRVPGVRAISADIRKANDGETISHGHVHNILNGDAENLTDRTRNLLGRFFGKAPSYFFPPSKSTPSSPDAVTALAARFATFAPDQLAVIRQAIEIVELQTARDEGQIYPDSAHD